MTRDELRERIKDEFDDFEQCIERGGEPISGIYADVVLALIEKEGYKSPEQCRQEFMIEFEAWAKGEYGKEGQ
jgi:hypothetical protein